MKICEAFAIMLARGSAPAKYDNFLKCYIHICKLANKTFVQNNKITHADCYGTSVHNFLAKTISRETGL